MRADVHMHSFFSHDSETHPEEMIKGAIQKNLQMICFTDHYDKDYMEWGQESIFDADEDADDMLMDEDILSDFEESTEEFAEDNIEDDFM